MAFHDPVLVNQQFSRKLVLQPAEKNFDKN
jgi:hypothetical protein